VKILGNTPEGDLIIQVSQAEWDSLRNGIRPESNLNSKTDSALELLKKIRYELERNRLKNGVTNPPLSRVVCSALRHWEYGDLSIEQFLKNLSDPMFLAGTRGIGLKSAELLSNYLKQYCNEATLAELTE